MKNEQGFSLIEVMVSMATLGLFLTGLLPFAMGQAGFNMQSQRRTEAAMVAQVKLDNYRLTDPVTLPSSGSVGPEVISHAGRDFDVLTQFCSEPSYCINSNIRHIRVSVMYRGNVLYTGETVYTKLR